MCVILSYKMTLSLAVCCFLSSSFLFFFFFFFLLVLFCFVFGWGGGGGGGLLALFAVNDSVWKWRKTSETVAGMQIRTSAFLCWCAWLVCVCAVLFVPCLQVLGEGRREREREREREVRNKWRGRKRERNRQTDRDRQTEVDAEEVSMGTEEEVRGGGWGCNEFPLPFMTKIPASAADGESH